MTLKIVLFTLLSLVFPTLNAQIVLEDRSDHLADWDGTLKWEDPSVFPEYSEATYFHYLSSFAQYCRWSGSLRVCYFPGALSVPMKIKYSSSKRNDRFHIETSLGQRLFLSEDDLVYYDHNPIRYHLMNFSHFYDDTIYKIDVKEIKEGLYLLGGTSHQAVTVKGIMRSDGPYEDTYHFSMTLLLGSPLNLQVVQYQFGGPEGISDQGFSILEMVENRP